jgi:hypothetical protein
VAGKILGDGYPIPLFEKEGLLENDAPDRIVRLRVRRDSTVPLYALAHDFAARCAIPNSERLPGNTERQNGEGGEESTTSDHVLRGMELEQKGLTGL